MRINNQHGNEWEISIVYLRNLTLEICIRLEELSKRRQIPGMSSVNLTSLLTLVVLTVVPFRLKFHA